jgi:hypothetical protein
MKQFYIKFVFTLCMVFTANLNAQTYTIDASGTSACSANTGIDNLFLCISPGGAANIGTFKDTNTSVELNSMAITIYDACNGDFEVFLNNVSLGTGTTTGANCACESIKSNPNITKNISVTITPAIKAAYVIGGINTVSISTKTQQCFYGVVMTVGTTGTLGVENFNENNTIKVYPNSASTAITISGLRNQEDYRIYDSLGAEIMKGTISNDEKIEIQNISNGFYFLKFKNGVSLKFIKE